MPIEFQCSNCAKLLRVPDGSGGKKAKCPDCGTILAVPAEAAPPASTGPTSPLGGSAGQPSPGLFAERPETSGQSANPYQSPAAPMSQPAGYPGAAPGPYNPNLAASKVKGPAIAMIIFACLTIALILVDAVLFLTGVTQDILDLPPQNEAERVFQLICMVIGLAIKLPIYGIILYGASQMKNLRNYGWAMAASILSIIPCSYCCPLGIAFGIWGLVVLSDPMVKSSFR